MEKLLKLPKWIGRKPYTMTTGRLTLVYSLGRLFRQNTFPHTPSGLGPTPVRHHSPPRLRKRQGTTPSGMCSGPLRT